MRTFRHRLTVDIGCPRVVSQALGKGNDTNCEARNFEHLVVCVVGTKVKLVTLIAVAKKSKKGTGRRPLLSR